MADVTGGLWPGNTGLQMSVKVGGKHADSSRKKSGSSEASSTMATANPQLSVIEVESILRNKVKNKVRDLQVAFQNYDVNQALSITRGEFRRVLESFCLPLTTEQFNAVMNKVDTNPNGTVRYCDFLDKFYSSQIGGTNKREEGPAPAKRPATTQQYVRTQSPKEMNTDMIEKMLKEKIAKNIKNVTKALRLYDYNRDGQIQRHELRKVLENYCFRMTDPQFDKLYQRYDFHHRGVLNYRDFMLRLGVNVEKNSKPPAPEGTTGALQWQQNSPAAPKLAPVIVKPEDSEHASLTFHEIEVEFRKKMRLNYGNLKRIFIAFDKNLDGFISLEDLKSILNQFTVPMSDPVFMQLMERFEIKGSGRVSWEYVLEKFQDPQSHGNGQTLPIKPSHKFFPIRGINEKIDLRNLIRLLHNHVTNAYSSFKEAFLQLDKNRDGKISRKELRSIIANFKFNVSDAQFKELMILLDPQHTNFISYHKFLELFEERESLKEGHKWLKSTHRFNDQQKPAILAWDTVEGLLREKITENWKELSEEIVRSDNLGTGKMKPIKLRRIVEKYTLPISDDHYNNLMNKIEDREEDGQVSYIEFFLHLGVSVSPGDLEGVSTQIQRASDKEENRMAADQDLRHDVNTLAMQDRTTIMSADEIIVRLKDRLSQHDREMRQAFTKYDKAGRGKISKKNFKNVIEAFGFYLSDDQFRELCSKLAFHNGHMTYTDFISNFEDPRFGGPSAALAKNSNHHVNPIRGDQFGMTAEDVVSKLLSKLRQNFEDLRGAFYKFDDDHNGLLTKANFRRMLDSFMCIMSDEEYERFCAMMGITKKSKVGYKEFLDRFEVRDSAEGHKWLNSVHRYNEVKPMHLMLADNVHKVLVQKAHQQWSDLAKAFRTMDNKGNGVITRRELRETLYKFMLPMSKEEFKKLWAMYDKEGKGFVSHKDFLNHLTGVQFASGDGGTSKNIVDNSDVAMGEHLLHQQEAHDRITMNQATRAEDFSIDQLLQQLRDRIRDTYRDFYTAFKKYDKKLNGYLTVADLQKVLVDFSYFIDDDQFYDLLERLGMSAPKSKMSYDQFCEIFEEGRKETFQPQPEQVYYPQMDNEHLASENAVEKLRKQAASNLESLQSAFQAFDKTSTGRIKLPDFRRVLDNFVFKLSDKQFNHLKISLTIHNSDNSVDYPVFIDSFKDTDLQNDTQKWMESMSRRLQEVSPQLLSDDQVEQTLKEMVPAKFHAISKALGDVDYAKIGVVPKEDFKDILFKYTLRLQEEQFETLWSTLKVNEFNNLEYKDFLRKFAEGQNKESRPATSAGIPTSRRPFTSDSAMGRDCYSSHGGRASSLGGRHSRIARPFTPMVNAEDAEQKLREKIYKHWKDIQKQCRAGDPQNTGVVGQADFRHILDRYNFELSPDQERKLLLKYDIRNNDTFSYPEFLRHFVLDMPNQGQPETARETSRSLLGRKKVINTLQVHTEEPEEQVVGDMPAAAAARLRECVMKNWKDMRRDWRGQDQNAIGVVSHNDFRQVLRNYQLNLSEQEFYYLSSNYDRDMMGQINYNDFIRTFLKN